MLDLAGVAADYAAGCLTPSALIEAIYDRIAGRGEDAVWISLVPRATSLDRARALEGLDPAARAALPLWGMPFSIKDCIDLAGLPTSSACPDFAYAPSATNPAIARLLAAGAIPIGKTNLDQFATGLVGTRSPYGIPRNPYGAEYVPGGSSSGAAVSVAAGLVAFAIGTDTGGSGRVPAAFNNLVGLKPTSGLLSGRGSVAACPSIESLSIFAADVATARAVADWRALGVAVVEIDYTPFLELNALLFQGPFLAERYGPLAGFLAARPHSVLPVTREILLRGASFDGAAVFCAQAEQRLLKRRIAALWEDIDALLLPTTPSIPRLAAVAADPLGLNYRLGTYTNFVNLADLAALALPAGFLPNGLPQGVCLIGPAFSDAALAAAGARFLAERAPSFPTHEASSCSSVR